MARPHLLPAIEEMQIYLMTVVYPHVMEREILTRDRLTSIMKKNGLPPKYRILQQKERGCVLYEALDNLGWSVYSRKNRHMIQAWTKPEVIRNV